jgi:hypothetical protein
MTERTELAASPGATAAASPSRSRWPWSSTFDLDRLDAAIADLNVQRTTRPDDRSAWGHRADAYLAMANEGRADGRIDAAWAGLKAARRELIESFDTTEVELEATRLQREGTSKLKGWRLEALTALLTPVLAAQAVEVLDDGSPAPPRSPGASKGSGAKSITPAEARSRVKEAARIFEDHEDNVYRKLRIFRRHLAGAAVVLVAVLAITAATLFAIGYRPSGDPFITDWRAVIVVMVLGALGAAVSGVLAPLARDPAERIPDAAAQSALVWVRPFIGAGAAVIVVAILHSGIGGVSITPEAAGVVALAAGFSERLVGQSVAMASSAISRQ